MTLGQWFGHWLGDWFGPLEAAPEGSIAGSATITVGATGAATAIGHMAGSASVTVGGSGALTGVAEVAGTATITINGTGTLTDAGGVVPDTRLDQILAILMGRKVYDSATGLWRVYDENGVELADPSGILLRGLHGWLLLAANQQQAEEEQVPTGGGNYRWLNPRRKTRKEIEEERIKLGIIEKEKVVVAVKKADVLNEEGEAPDYWALHLYESLLAERAAAIQADIAIQRARDTAQLLEIKDALARQEAMRLVFRRQQIIEADMVFVMTILAEA